jgi:hypothetical protein
MHRFCLHFAILSLLDCHVVANVLLSDFELHGARAVAWTDWEDATSTSPISPIEIGILQPANGATIIEICNNNSTASTNVILEVLIGTGIMGTDSESAWLTISINSEIVGSMQLLYCRPDILPDSDSAREVVAQDQNGELLHGAQGIGSSPRLTGKPCFGGVCCSPNGLLPWQRLSLRLDGLPCSSARAASTLRAAVDLSASIPGEPSPLRLEQAAASSFAVVDSRAVPRPRPRPRTAFPLARLPPDMAYETYAEVVARCDLRGAVDRRDFPGFLQARRRQPPSALIPQI